MSSTPPDDGAEDQQTSSSNPETSAPGNPPAGPAGPRDPSGYWQWDLVRQEWVPAHLLTANPGQAQPAPASAPQQQAYAPPPAQAYPPPAQGYAPPPAQGYAPPAQGYPPVAPYPGPGAPGQGRGKSRRNAYIAIAAVVVVAAGVLIGVFALGGGSTKKTAADTVKTYLTDLANGDAKGALAQGSPPPSTTFANAAVLKQQLAKAKISNIKIGNTQTIEDEAHVQATYQFGTRSADVTFVATKTGGTWKLKQTTVPMDLSLLDNVPQPTLFGTPVANRSKAYVFPGPLTWGSKNPYVTVTDRSADEFALSPFDMTASFTQLSVALTDTGKQAATAAVSKAFATCAASRKLIPPGCPQREFGIGTDGFPVDDTVRWTAPTDLSGLQYGSFTSDLKLDVSGTTTWKATYKARDFGTDKVTTVTDPDVKANVFGTIDMSASPPTFEPF